MPDSDDNAVDSRINQMVDAALARRFTTPPNGTLAPVQTQATPGNSQTGAGTQIVIEAQRESHGSGIHPPVPFDPVLYALGELRTQLAEVRINVQSLVTTQADIKADIKALNTDVGGLRTSFNTMEKELKGFEARLQKLEATASMGNVPEEVLRQVVGRAVEDGMRAMRRQTSAEAPTKAHQPPGEALVKKRAADGWISVPGLVKIIGALASLAAAMFAGGKLLGS